jgi:ubiquinone/menaquinone biosynthesis C-methylase UbiE
MQGWVNLWQKLGMYERPTLDHSFQLPYLQAGVWEEVARMFDMALDEMQLNGNEVILDMGAGQGWASRYFAAKGCRVIATDIVDDEWYGLGRAWAIMDRAGVYFEPMLADGENLPFPADTFDIVFFCGALHHFRDAKGVLAQVFRVLKPGGRLIATGEPAIAISTPEKSIQAQLDEVEQGIVERRPKVFEYWQKTWGAGFRKIRIDTFETYKRSHTDVIAWIKDVRTNLVQHARLRYKPLIWVDLTIISWLPSSWAGALTVLLNGGNLFIRGTKPR